MNFHRSTRHGSHLVFIVAGIVLTMSIGMPKRLCAQQSGVESATVVAHLNADGRRDTVYCRELGDGSFLPSRIAWGSDSGATAAASATRILYPGWQGLRGSVAVLKYNEDTLADVLLFLRGTDTTGGVRRDTVRRLVIFGQERLKDRPTIVLTQVARTQTTPFFSLDLTSGMHLVEARAREVSRRRSYRLAHLQFDVNDTSDEGVPLPAPLADEPPSTEWVLIYPNPAIYSTTLEASLSTPGLCEVRVIAIDGRNILHRTVAVGTTGRIFERLDVSEVPSGFYELRIEQTGRAPRSFPVVVVR